MPADLGFSSCRWHATKRSRVGVINSVAGFGAPVALEDHAVRACLAALGIQDEANRLAVEVNDRDGIDLRLRVG